MTKSSQSDDLRTNNQIMFRALQGAGAGLLTGFLAASVVYSALPAFVPSAISESPLVFFGLLMAICATLGYFWMLCDLLECSGVEKRVPPLNTMISGAFIGFLMSVVIYTNLVEKWMPASLTVYPIMLFVLSAVLGALTGFIWSRTAS